MSLIRTKTDLQLGTVTMVCSGVSSKCQMWQGILKRRIHSENASNIFRPHHAGGIWKRSNHWSKTRSGKSHDYRDAIVFEKLRFQNENEKPAFSTFLLERFRDGLVWTEGLTVELKPRFQIPPE